MIKPLQILHLEDNARDAELIAALLSAEWPGIRIVRVESHGDFEATLNQGEFDLVVSDFSLPSWDGHQALEATRKHSPDLPFIFCSGTIGEEAAIEAVRKGATDYVIKDRPERLVTSVRRALQEKAGRAQRLQAEQQIREQAALIDQARDAIFVCDLEDRITFWSQGAERMYGWPRSEAIGRISHKLLFKRIPSDLAMAQSQFVEHGQWEGVVEQVTREGAILVVESRWTLLRDEHANPKARLAINTDITEKKLLETQLLRTQRLESIGTLASGVAHDLNNALAPMLMGLQLLSVKTHDPASVEVIQSLDLSVRRAASIVKQILSFTRGVGGERVAVQLKHIINEQEKICRETFPPSLRFQKRVSAQLWTVKGDATQLHQILMNLAVNARDAMPDGGLLTIEAENVVHDQSDLRAHPDVQPGRFISLTVKDTGNGIAPEIIDKIFDPFFTTKEPGQGTGLGLSTVIGIVRSHGGFIDVWSEPGRGSSFKIQLPASDAPETPPGVDESTGLSPGNGELVLVVDDQESIREVVKATLEASNYRVLTAADGTECVALYVRHRQDVRVVITDMMMPYLDGPSTIRTLQRLNPDVKVIAISGTADQAMMAAGAGDANISFLQKPFSAGKLLLRLHELLWVGGPVNP